jgi:hypothetical protein
VNRCDEVGEGDPDDLRIVCEGSCMARDENGVASRRARCVSRGIAEFLASKCRVGDVVSIYEDGSFEPRYEVFHSDSLLFRDIGRPSVGICAASS